MGKAGTCRAVPISGNGSSGQHRTVRRLPYLSLLLLQIREIESVETLLRQAPTMLTVLQDSRALLVDIQDRGELDSAPDQALFVRLREVLSAIIPATKGV